MVSEKQKQYARKWDKENMRTLCCRVRTNEAEYFKKWCEMHNTTPCAYLKQVVYDCTEDYFVQLEKQKQEQKNEQE